MELLFITNLLFAVALLFAPFWWARFLLNQNWLNPVTVMVIFMIPVDIFRLFIGQLYAEGLEFQLNNLMNTGYQFAVLVTNIQGLIGLFMILLAARLHVVRKLPYKIPQMGDYSVSDLRRLAWIFFIFYILAFLMLAIRTGGIGSWLSDIRGSYMAKRDGNGVFYAAAVSFLSISYFFEGVSSTRSIIFALRSLIYFGAVYVLGSKGFILLFFIFFLVIVQRLGQVNLKRALFFVMPAAFVLLLINFASQSDTLVFSDIAEYFNYYPNAAKYYTDYFSGHIPLFHGKVFLTSFWEYVPRSLYPDKPYVYGVLHVVEIFYPGGAESGNTPAFESVAQFADFGLLGVVLFTLFNWSPLVRIAALIYALRDRAFLDQGPMSGRTILVSLLLFAPAFGTFLPLGLVVMLLVFILALSKFTKIVRRTFMPS